MPGSQKCSKIVVLIPFAFLPAKVCLEVRAWLCSSDRARTSAQVRSIRMQKQQGGAEEQLGIAGVQLSSGLT